MNARAVASGPGWQLFRGRWQDHIPERCDAVITDPPYGERCHAGQQAASYDDSNRLAADGLGYAHWTPADVAHAVERWHDVCEGWIVAQTSHDMIPAWETAYTAVGRYSFAPLACVMRAMNVRLAGDGPSNWTVYAMASRPRTKEYATWGTLPGAYTGGPNRDGYRSGGKPLWLMRALIRDYTRPGDLVWDPCAGGGTTLVAALMEGRRAIGCEVDPEAFDVAAERLSQRRQAVLL